MFNISSHVKYLKKRKITLTFSRMFNIKTYQKVYLHLDHLT